jgi:hypothetical protein
VETEGRVHGAERLSVVDASVMPDVPSGFTHYGLVERREFLKSVLADVKVRDGKVSASYRPAFKVLARMAAETGRPPALGGLGRRSSKVNVWGRYLEDLRTASSNTFRGLRAGPT